MAVSFNFKQNPFVIELYNESFCANQGFKRPLCFQIFAFVLHQWSCCMGASMIFDRALIIGKIEHAHVKLLTELRSSERFAIKTSMGNPRFSQQLNETKLGIVSEAENGESIEQFQKLGKAQAPKFMVIACADSRVCPSNILGFQPGEAFMICNVANLVPPFEVEHILVIGHSYCGGIHAFMSMQDDSPASFIKSWVVGKNTRIKTETAASVLCFDQQCRHCEKESVNHSLLNLLTYPWIEEKVANGELFVDGGYYNFDCSFEKWTLDYRETKVAGNGKVAVDNKMFWC